MVENLLSRLLLLFLFMFLGDDLTILDTYSAVFTLLKWNVTDVFLATGKSQRSALIGKYCPTPFDSDNNARLLSEGIPASESVQMPRTCLIERIWAVV